MSIKTLYITYMGLTEPLLQSQAVNYLKDLSQKGIKVRIFSFEKKQFLSKDNIKKIRCELDQAGIKWSYLVYHSRPQLLCKPYDILRGMFFVIWNVLKEGIGVIHARGTLAALIGAPAMLILRKKMIFDMRGLMAEEYVDAGLWGRKSLRYKVVNNLERYFIKMAGELIILNNKAKEFLSESKRGGNITVIPTCVNLVKFNFKSGIDHKISSRYPLSGKFVLIYTGSLGSWYMLSEMLAFYSELSAIKEKSVFFILSQTDKKWIMQHIPVNLAGKVIVDSASPENVPAIVNLADAGIFFIKPCKSKIVSSPTKFGEYLACGLPVVISRGIGDTADIVKENRIGVVVEDFTPAEYRKRINELKELLREGELLAKRCRSVAERFFSLEEGVERYKRVYSRIAAG